MTSKSQARAAKARVLKCGCYATWARAIAPVAVCMCILLNFAVPLVGQAARRNKPHIPLVLISEPVKGGQEHVEQSLWAKAGLVSKLESSGYEQGKTLFVFTPDKPYSDLDSGAYALREILNEAVVATGCNTLDVAAYGVSGLVLRFGLEMGLLEDGFIDNAIMLNTPQRGSFLADFLLQVCNIVKHECMFDQETRQARFSPFGEVSPTLDPKSIPAKSTGELPGSIGSGNFSWEGEAWWVATRAREIYEPLYSQYVQERFLSLPYVPVDSPKQSFAGWIKQNRPLIWENCIARGNEPPFGPVPDTAVNSPPQKGQDFTAAYYEILAMAVGKNQYAVRMASAGSLAKSLFTQEYVPGSLKDAVVHYGLKALLHYAKKALVTVKAEVQKIIADSIVSSIGYLDNPESGLLRRLVKEDILVNLGTSAGQRFYRVPANHYLKLINQESASASCTRKTRFVSITGRVTNLLSAVWPQVGPNNLFCEVDSAIPPQGPRDIILVFSGFLSPSYLNLLKDKRVHDSIVSLLLGPEQVCEFAVKEMERKEIKASSWQPSYVSVPWDMSQSQVFDVTIHVSSLPEGWGCAVWIEGYDGGRWLPVPGWNRVLTRGAEVDVMLKNRSYRVGLRLARLGAANPYTPGGKVESVFERELSCETWVSAQAIVSGSPSEENSTGPGLDPEAGSGLNPADPISGHDGPGNTDAPGSQEDSADNEDIPSVRVVYRSKHTTLWKPHEVYHSYWELDFGDGEAVIVQGQPHLEISHTFSPSGLYTVRATSYDNHNNVLLEKGWNVEITGEEPEVREFSCTSVIRPEVELELAGPGKWVTGKHALFSGRVTWNLPDGAQVASVDCDPGETFHVLWERSGEFTVLWAVTLTIDYELEGRAIKVKNTYLTSMAVDVFTSGISR